MQQVGGVLLGMGLGLLIAAAIAGWLLILGRLVAQAIEAEGEDIASDVLCIAWLGIGFGVVGWLLTL